MTFGAPWVRGASRTELTLAAEEPCRATITVNGRPLGEVDVTSQPRPFDLSIEPDLLRPWDNELSIQAPVEAGLRVERWVVPPTSSVFRASDGRRWLRFLPAQPPSSITYEIRPEPEDELRFEVAYSPSWTARVEGGLRFEVFAESEEGETLLHRRDVPAGESRPEVLEEVRLDLSRWAGREVALRFETRDLQGKVPYQSQVGWVRPRIESESPTVSSERSLLVWLTDTLRADRLGTYGVDRPTSAHLDRFGRDALVFRSAVSHASWTRASIASLLTGLLPSSHGAVGRADRLLDHVRTLPQHLSEAGYSTVAFSANANFYSLCCGVWRGFDEVWTYSEMREEGSTELILRDALRWLEQHREEPVFLFVHTVDPHEPYAPPPHYLRALGGSETDPHSIARSISRLRRGRSVTPTELDRIVDLYDAEVAANDAAFGRLLGHLRASGLDDRFIVMMTSDHGEELSDHGSWGHGHELYQEQVLLPLSVRVPEVDAGLVSGVVREIDLFPTLLDWLAVDGPEVEGESLAGELEASNAVPSRHAVLEQSLDDNRLVSVLDGRHKYVRRVSPKSEEALYDLAVDPAESENVLDQRPEVAARLAERVRSHLEAGVPSLRVAFASREEQRVVGSLRTPTPVTWVRGFGFPRGAEHHYWLSDDRRVLWFKFPPSEGARGLELDLPGSSGEFTLELEDDWRVVIGEREAKPPEAAGISFAISDLTPGSADPTALEGSVCQVSGLGSAEHSRMALTPEEEENLKALGYLE